ncbi:MAG: PKD domain-containing protein [Vicinamibacteria bacterium]|nr:PKD domain-containing protein [Vicinamibacteria bacterium]
MIKKAILAVALWTCLSDLAVYAADPAKGEVSVTVTSLPSRATILIDGQEQGVTPLEVTGLDPGVHELALVKHGYVRYTRRLVLTAGRSVDIDINLTPEGGASASQSRPVSAPAGKSSARKWILIGGGAAMAGAGVYLATQRDQPPEAGQIQVTPTGDGLEGATDFQFASQGARDPEGKVLTARWTFGDGGTGEGQSVAHTYSREGAYEVALTVSDGKNAAVAKTQVTVRDVTGFWSGSYVYYGYSYPFTFNLTQDNATIRGTYVEQGYSLPLTGYISAPRNIQLLVNDSGDIVGFNGTLDTTLDTITGNVVGFAFTARRN